VPIEVLERAGRVLGVLPQHHRVLHGQRRRVGLDELEPVALQHPQRAAVDEQALVRVDRADDRLTGLLVVRRGVQPHQRGLALSSVRHIGAALAGGHLFDAVVAGRVRQGLGNRAGLRVNDEDLPVAETEPYLAIRRRDVLHAGGEAARLDGVDHGVAGSRVEAGEVRAVPHGRPQSLTAGGGLRRFPVLGRGVAARIARVAARVRPPAAGQGEQGAGREHRGHPPNHVTSH
jgi:hypothetical protein